MKWIKASEKIPELYPVNASSELHYKLDGRKVDGFFLHSQCFEYFDVTISGYSQIEGHEFGRIEYLDESPTAQQQGESGELPDIYKGELNTKRIAEYRRVGQAFSVDEGTIRDVFCAGADWYKSLVTALSLPSPEQGWTTPELFEYLKNIVKYKDVIKRLQLWNLSRAVEGIEAALSPSPKK